MVANMCNRKAATRYYSSREYIYFARERLPTGGQTLTDWITSLPPVMLWRMGQACVERIAKALAGSGGAANAQDGGEAERTVAEAAAIGLVLADASAIRRAGISALVRRDAQLVVLGETGSADDACGLVARFQPAVCLIHAELVRTDRRWLGRLAGAAPPTALVVYDADVSGNRVPLLLDAGVHRVLSASTSAAQLLAVLHAVGAPGRRERGVARAPAGLFADTERDGAAPWAAETSDDLTEQQRLILGLVIDGHSNSEIAARLQRSEHTVRAHLQRAYQRIGVQNRAQAAGWLIANGWYRADLPKPGDSQRIDEC